MNVNMIKRGVLPNGDIAANTLHDRIPGNDVTRFRKDMGLVPNGLPASGSKIKVKGRSIWITRKERVPDPNKPRKMIWVSKTELSHWVITSFGHDCPVIVTNLDYMQDGVTYDAIVIRVSRVTDRLPTLTVTIC